MIIVDSVWYHKIPLSDPFDRRSFSSVRGRRLFIMIRFTLELLFSFTQKHFTVYEEKICKKVILFKYKQNCMTIWDTWDTIRDTPNPEQYPKFPKE